MAFSPSSLGGGVASPLPKSDAKIPPPPASLFAGVADRTCASSASGAGGVVSFACVRGVPNVRSAGGVAREGVATLGAVARGGVVMRGSDASAGVVRGGVVTRGRGAAALGGGATRGRGAGARGNGGTGRGKRRGGGGGA